MGYSTMLVDLGIVICLGIFYIAMRARDSWTKGIDERLKKIEEE